MVGRTISHYKILEKIGEGGMGVVYKARDTRLDRTVALKFLSGEAVEEEESKQRFLHEARAAAALNHTSICTIHEIDEVDGQPFIAMEYVEGESLRRKVQQRPLKLDEALDIATQVGHGLQAAHEKGIVHRDIKSANVMLTAEGQVKVMDFGLAHLGDKTRITKTGTMLGSPAYMSPEQARGETADRRTDIWSFGVMVYEMISGQLPFKGEADQAVLHSILNDEPEPLTAMRSGLPVELDRVVEKALVKEAGERYQHMDEMLVDLGVVRKRVVSGTRPAGMSATLPVQPKLPIWQRLIPWALAGLLALSVFLWSPWRERSQTERLVSRFVTALPEGREITALWSGVAISPDGTKLVFVARREGVARLHWRRLDGFLGNELPGTDHANFPVFSPDGDWVAFLAGQELKKVSLQGGSPHTICKFGSRGISWGEDGNIVMEGFPSPGLWLVHSDGGEPVPVTQREKGFLRDEMWHSFPQYLPGGRSLLFSGVDPGGTSRVAVISLETGERKTLIERASQARYVPSGHILCLRGAQGDLHAAPFNLEKLEVTGTPVPVVGDLRTYHYDRAHYAISDRGTLVYVAGGPTRRNRLVWTDRTGKTQPLPFEPKYYLSPRISPDGEWLSVTTEGGKADVWICNPERGTSRRLTDDEGGNFFQLWSPDGKRIVFNSDRHGDQYLNIYRKAVDGSSGEERLTEFKGNEQPQCWTPGGESLLFTRDGGTSTGYDIWLLPAGGDGGARPVIKTRAQEIHPVLSPDGHWIAYCSGESGRQEVYVRSFPDPGDLRQVSTDGGSGPLWSPDGRELYYRLNGNPYAVAFRTESELAIGKPEGLFAGNFVSDYPFGRNYDISRDGQRFLMLQHADDPPIDKLHVVLNWFEELRRKVPTGN